ncbi:unnamed protein product [Owenia fusiformis]|uniref:Uncharacterized protein n=1 Tax=Owenia fusiformis TaxID=6347 RepID=A0A8J1UGT4_OWEFU|nr:unnamed protein product [Owenia fusiformis]
MSLTNTAAATATLCEQIALLIIRSNDDLVGNTTERTIGTHVSIKCLPGYGLSTESSSDVLTCLRPLPPSSVATWDKPVPTCSYLPTSGTSLSEEATIILVASLFGAVILTLFIIVVCCVVKWRRDKIERYKWMSREQKINNGDIISLADMGGGKAMVAAGGRGGFHDGLYATFRGRDEMSEFQYGESGFPRGFSSQHLAHHGSRPDMVHSNSNFAIPRPQVWESDYGAHGLDKTMFPS